jgi:competence protein ComEA
MEEQTWWRSPRLVAAAACFLLGSAVLAASFIPRWATAAAVPAAVAGDPLGGLDEFGPEPAGSQDEAKPLPAAPEPQVEAAPELVVYVTGAVLAPDVYRLPAGARVKDAVVAAGGLSPDAASEQVNLAEPVSDAQHVHVPFFTDLASPAVAGAEDGPAEPSQPGEGGEGGDGLIDLNRASAAELEELPGVGPTLAARILARREEQGPYGSVEELNEVTGVGAKLFAQIAPLVTVGP